jgi:hypothetical protein
LPSPNKNQKNNCPNFHHFVHTCQKWSFWCIIVNHATIYNCHGQWPWCNHLNDKKNLIPIYTNQF